ncbi:hypothetical protein FA13DRAFT_1733526 [Coprinellus micaceus]|uniref:Uncharacterized protein n=1 Tax=Coprinellus micaceus TaxID=71717 RepID=A0A4Y7T990_COPMI|nr:hypothetical protein FA13DRAFT_1733526 [Coprinellus micaceus]
MQSGNSSLGWFLPESWTEFHSTYEAKLDSSPQIRSSAGSWENSNPANSFSSPCFLYRISPSGRRNDARDDLARAGKYEGITLHLLVIPFPEVTPETPAST